MIRTHLLLVGTLCGFLSAQDAPGVLDATVNLGFKASNYYRNRDAGDNFFGIRGMFQVETERTWITRKDLAQPFSDVRLFGSVMVDGKNESGFQVQEADTTQTYLRRVVKETSNYSAEVGLKVGLYEWSPEARVWLVGSWTFRNASQRAQRFDTQGAPIDADAKVEFSDQSKALDKLGLRLGDRTTGARLSGSFLELAHLYDRFYTYEKNRFQLRGRLAVKAAEGKRILGWLSPDGFYVEGGISRAWARGASVEKDESTVVFGIRYTLAQ
ncbi:MAG TPA: hypothetical protein VJ623_12395 [Holophagaceae bacterium]|nr:hypothetical protein [Holophagaceae bacterium]